MSSRITFYINPASRYCEGIKVVDHASARDGQDTTGDGHRVCALLSGYMGLMEIAAEREAVKFVLRSVNPANDILPPTSSEPPSRSLFWKDSAFISKMAMCVFHVIQLVQLEYPKYLSVDVIDMTDDCNSGETGTK